MDADVSRLGRGGWEHAMEVNLEERHTAGKRIRIETLWNGTWHRRGGGLQEMIQTLADEGYNFAGKVDEYMPTGTIAAHTQDYLFIKAPE